MKKELDVAYMQAEWARAIAEGYLSIYRQKTKLIDSDDTVN